MRTCQKCDGKGTIQPDGEPVEEGGVVAALKCSECDGVGATRTVVDDLRALANFLDARPDFPTLTTPVFNAFLYDKQRFRDAARLMGGAKKCSIGDFFFLQKSFGEIHLDVCIGRNLVCTRREVGRRIIAAKPAQAERIVPIYEWDCANVLGGPEDEETQRDEDDLEAQAIDAAYEQARDAGTLPEYDEHGVRIEPE